MAYRSLWINSLSARVVRVRGIENLAGQAVINFLCAASVGTAIAFAYILPQINDLPSPKKQRAELERLVKKRTREKDILIHEINHRIGNQLQVLSSLVSVESRRAKSDEAIGILSGLKQTLDKMGEEHLALQASDYLAIADQQLSIAIERFGLAAERIIPITSCAIKLLTRK